MPALWGSLLRELRLCQVYRAGQWGEEALSMKDYQGDIYFDFWACQRPLTRSWGSGQVYPRIIDTLGEPDVVFGVTDNIPEGVITVDITEEATVQADWNALPFDTNQFEFGYWDPPYDHLYKREGMEIFRTVKRLAILHTHIWPRAWLERSHGGPIVREAMIAITMGPMKAMRCLQVFRKEG